MTAEQWFRQHGPVAAEDAEYDPWTLTLKQAGIRRLRPTKQSGNSGETSTGNVKSIFYFPDDHSKDDVLREFFRKNPAWREMSPREAANRLPEEFRDAYRSLRKAGLDNE